MAIAMTVKDYLEQCGVEYDVITHSPTNNSIDTAKAAHIPGDCLAKPVVLQDEQGYVMAVLPATHYVHLGLLGWQLNRNNLHLADEYQFISLFRDCSRGAIPPIGKAYGLPTVMDDSLMQRADIYFEAGNHKELIHVKREQFLQLMKGVEQCHISCHM